MTIGTTVVTNTKKVLLTVVILIVPGAGVAALIYVAYKKWKERNERRKENSKT